MKIKDLEALVAKGNKPFFFDFFWKNYFGTCKQQAFDAPNHILYTEDRANCPAGLPSWKGAVIDRATGDIVGEGEGFSRSEARRAAVLDFGGKV